MILGVLGHVGVEVSLGAGMAGELAVKVNQDKTGRNPCHWWVGFLCPWVLLVTVIPSDVGTDVKSYLTLLL